MAKEYKKAFKVKLKAESILAKLIVDERIQYSVFKNWSYSVQYNQAVKLKARKTEEKHLKIHAYCSETLLLITVKYTSLNLVSTKQ